MISIFCSALAVNCAFFFPVPFGLFILFFFVPLILDQQLTFTKGFWWGVMVFGPHFVWLAVLLATRSHAPLPLAIAGYLGIVVYFSLTSGAWFLFIRRISIALQAMVRYASALRSHSPRAENQGRVRPEEMAQPSSGRVQSRMLLFFSFLLTTACYYYFIENYSLIIFGRFEGYPFLNPLIPLVQYHPFLWLVAKAGAFMRWVTFGGALVMTPLVPDDVRLVYLPPVAGLHENPVALGQRIYHKLAGDGHESLFPEATAGQKQTAARETNKPLIIVTPETFYPFSLNRHQEQVALWSSVVPDEAYMVIGSQVAIGSKFYQAAYLLQSGLINKYYVKHHCAPFVEKIPKLWRRVAPLRKLFLQDADEFSRGKQPLGDGVFVVGETICLIPQICSEFFFTLSAVQVWDVCRAKSAQKQAIVFLVNDSWFVGYFQRILKALTELKAAYLGLPVIYVGHSACQIFSTPNN